MSDRDQSLPNAHLRTERKRRNWTLQQVADHLYDLCVAEGRERIGINADIVGRWERGVSRPTSHYRTKLCQLYNKTPKELGLIDDPTASEPLSLAFQNGQKEAILSDISHIVGREDVVQQLLEYLESPPGKPRVKFGLLYGLTGVGKTSCLKLLHHHLLIDDRFAVFSYAFKSQTNKTPVEHLDNLLAALMQWLRIPQPDVPSLPSPEKRAEWILTELARKEKLPILLLDDVQVALERDGQLEAEWRQVLQAFVEGNHAATLYAASRESLWQGRGRVFVRELELEPLSAEAGVQVWRNLGFVAIDETLLRQATEKCGGNPGMIEIVAQHMQRPVPSMEWEHASLEDEMPEARRLTQFVDNPHILSHHVAITVYPLIDEIVRTQLSPEARDLLQVLALAPVPLAPALLSQLSPSPERAYADLRSATLLSRDHTRLSLPPLITESTRQHLTPAHIAKIEQCLIETYTLWLEQGTFLTDSEQGAVIAELIVFYLHHHCLLEAAQLLIEHGWLCIALGNIPWLSRVAQEVMAAFDWQASQQNEAGSLLVSSYLSRSSDTPGRQQATLRLYELSTTGTLMLTPRVSVYIMHHYLRHLVLQRRFAEAWALIEQTGMQYQDLQDSDPIAYAELLDQRAYVAGRWGDDLHLLNDKTDEAIVHWQEAVCIHTVCHDLLLRCERTATFLRANDLRYKRARILHDTACYQRCLGDYDRAEATLRDCLALKEQGYSLPTSLAISYDEQASLLAAQGRDQEALTASARALALVQTEPVGTSHRAARRTQGMLLINRGELLTRMGKWEEARAVLAQGLPLVEGTSRAYAAVKARNLLDTLQQHTQSIPQQFLDKQWFARYRDLASYSDVAWLSQAGPLDRAEQEELEQLRSCCDDPGIARHLSEIIAQSRRRELAVSSYEQREPRFCYPAIPLDEVLSKAVGLSRLRSDIEEREQNDIVRRLYLEAIDERTTELRLIESVARANDDLFWEYSQALNPAPDASTMKLALVALALLLREGLASGNTRALGSEILTQTRSWLINPLDLLNDEVEQLPSRPQAIPVKSERTFSPDTVQRFFEYVFQQYHFPWTIVQDPATDHARVNFARKQLVLPTDRQMSTTKIRALLAHEIEVHAFRAVAGEASPLALLSLGLGNSLETEEGLAVYYVQETARLCSMTEPDKSWIGTLATGLASGAMGEPYSFRRLLAFLERVTMLRSLLTESDQSIEDRQQRAHRTAQNRCLRTFRGVTNLTAPGICSTKDHVYLRGYLAVSRALEGHEATLDQLMVGVIGLHHLAAMSELGIVAPAIRHRKLALDAHLEKQIAAFAE